MKQYKFFKKKGADAFLFNLNNALFYGILSPDCKRGVYKDRQIVKICGAIDGDHSYTTIFNEKRTIPKVIIYAIFPNDEYNAPIPQPQKKSADIKSSIRNSKKTQKTKPAAEKKTIINTPNANPAAVVKSANADTPKAKPAAIVEKTINGAPIITPALDQKYYSFQAAMLAIAKAIAANPKIPKNENIAVIGFQETISKKRLGVSSAIENDLTNFLIEQRPKKVIVKNNVDTILNELKISRSGLFDSQNRKEFGKLAAAGLIVSGTYWLDDNDLVISAAVVDIQSGIAYCSYRTRIEKKVIDNKYFENEGI